MSFRSLGCPGGPSSFEWSTGGSITASLLSDQAYSTASLLSDQAYSTASLLSDQAYSSVVLVNDNNENSSMILDVSLGSHLHYYVCEGSPVLAAESASTPAIIPPAMTWVQLGNPSREFGFSSDKQTFHDARKMCAAQTGRVRLAVLDTLFEEVREWIEVNHPDGAFWVDAVRPVSDAEFVWADGKAVDASIWKEGDPDPNDLVARIMEKNNVTVFAGTATYDGRRYYVCERVPEVRLEWRVLGTQEKLFGFSRTHSWGLEWANETCLRQLGDVRLASLDTHFHDVIDTIETNYPDDQFWVDARRPNGDSTFQWANGTDVMSDMWHNGEPNYLYKVARIKNITDRNQTALKSSSSSNPPYYFICEGNPATPVHRTK
ncbi:hypothetical protein V1264_002622 [Littorina saxatilis]|uniref:C-type lectin domain-containing protein n=1 Tax=Littorina saxatilis TaxID=31220 RepID=A0AAN9B6F7_9CAEN